MEVDVHAEGAGLIDDPELGGDARAGGAVAVVGGKGQEVQAGGRGPRFVGAVGVVALESVGRGGVGERGAVDVEGDLGEIGAEHLDREVARRQVGEIERFLEAQRPQRIARVGVDELNLGDDRRVVGLEEGDEVSRRAAVD